MKEDWKMNNLEESNNLLNVLCLEDILNDANLIKEMLLDAGFQVSMDITDREDEYLSLLSKKTYDVILSDYTIPGFDVHLALKQALELQPDVPFICVSGTIIKDKAIELIKEGAVNYVLKDRLSRLPYAVRQALESVERLKEHRQAEDALIKSEYEFRLLAESMPQIVWITRADGCTTYFNQQWVDYTGLTLEESYGHGWNKPFHPDDQLRAWDAWKDAILNGTTYSLECRLRRKDGEYFWFLIRGVPVLDEHCKVLKWFGTYTDIHKMKLADEALQQSHDVLYKLAEQVPGVIYQYRLYPDGSSCFPYSSPGMNEIYEYSSEDVREDATPVFGRLHPDDSQYVSDLIFESARTLEHFHCEFRVVLPLQGLRWRYSDATPERLEDGSTLWHGIIYDITQRKNVEHELIKAKEHAEESDRLKSAFLANMSHEIRTPMNGILGFAELLKEPDLTGEEQQIYINIIEKGGERMLNIINDIISISKVESGQMELSISETNINAQIEFINSFFKPEAAQKSIEIFYKNLLPAKEATINTDSEKVYAVLTNLVKNALKFTKEGSIEIGYKKKDNDFEFFVKDTGTGILQEQKKIIFERFRQGSESLSRNYEGAGLGLTISKAYVEMLGGHIWVESEEGKGSTFYFTIPCNCDKVERSVISNQASGNIEENKMKNLKILIVEDDEASEMLINLTVNSLSKEILSVRSGTEAIEICHKHPEIDLILMDIKMPLMDGYEVTRQIRSFNKDVIIIAQTAFALTDDREKSLAAGCNDYLAKPIKKSTLIETITKHFNNNTVSV